MCCCNLSAGVALNARFTTNGMCAKNNTIYTWREQAIIEWLWRGNSVAPGTNLWTIKHNDQRTRRVIAAHDLYYYLLPQGDAHLPLGLSDRNSVCSMQFVWLWKVRWSLQFLCRPFHFYDLPAFCLQWPTIAVQIQTTTPPTPVQCCHSVVTVPY